MTNAQKAELIAFVEKGSKFLNIRFYNSACMVFEYPEGNEQICAEKWGFALIGKFGDPAVALKKYKELRDSLPESNPACFRMCYAVGMLLGFDWKELVKIHYVSNYNSRNNDELLKQVLNPSPEGWAQAVMEEAFARYEKRIAQMFAPPIN